MKLLYTLTPAQTEALHLAPGEKLWYCVPVDLAYDNQTKRVRESYTDRI